MAKRTGERIDGPFKHGRRWRLRIARPMGGRDYLSFATEAEAQVDTTTRSEAWMLGDGSVVVLIEGKAGGVHLSHVEVLP